MTTEMGPRDVELAFSERVAAHFVTFWAWLVSTTDGPTVRFDPESATVRVSGESDHSGDEFVRGRNITQLTSMNTVAMIGLAGVLAGAPIPSGALGGLYGLCSIALMLGCLLVVRGSINITSKIDVVDHTTEPAPEAVEDLKERYVAGELDDAELEREAAEVWQRD